MCYLEFNKRRHHLVTKRYKTCDVHQEVTQAQALGELFLKARVFYIDLSAMAHHLPKKRVLC